MKTKYFCYDCENEFKITSKCTDSPAYCPFCGSELETADADAEDEEEVE